MRKICFQIHKWLSIPFGIILAIVCLTGAILALEPELSELFYRSRYYVKEVQATPLPTEQLLEAAREQLPPSLEATGIQESDDPQRTYQITLKGKRKAAFIDPYTAKVVAIDDGTGFFMKTMRFHRWLYDTYKRGAFSWGKTIVGYSTLAMVIILITGLILWFPKKWQSWRNRFVIHTRNGWLRFWHDLHVVGGFYVSLFLLCNAFDMSRISRICFWNPIQYIFYNRFNAIRRFARIYGHTNCVSTILFEFLWPIAHQC